MIRVPLNGCSACRSDFTSLRLFDAHRVGKHAYTYSEGVAMTPIREDGRRCFSADEMLELGWSLDDRGRWSDPAGAELTREAFSAVSRRPKQATRALAETSEQEAPVGA